MNDSQFRLNPIVTLNHCYWAPPVGKSLWRKFVKDGDLRGIKAKTQYPARPSDWPGDWPADVAFSLVQADLLRGKSIGFLPTRVHVPDGKELEKSGWTKVGLVIDEWILLEYACVFLPAQQNAVVESVGKGLPPIPEDFQKALGITLAAPSTSPTPSGDKNDVPATSPARAEPIPFVALSTLESLVRSSLASLDPLTAAERAAQARLDRIRGRV
jgi:hypothetical protein